jgi:hypothetical protein
MTSRPLLALKSLNQLRLVSWKNGFNTHDLDYHMSRCRKFGPEPKPAISNGQHLFQKQCFGISGCTLMDATKHDSINMWLLSNLQFSSEEKKRHRAFLANSEELNEEQWARLVLKYWLLDEAATCLEDRPESTNGAVNSAGLCHSARVHFDDLGKVARDNAQGKQLLGEIES